MNKLFRPFNTRNPGQCCQDVAFTLAVSAVLASFIIIGVALWAIYHPPRLHQSNYAGYYNVTEYRRLTAVKEYHNYLHNSSSEEVRPVDAKL